MVSLLSLLILQFVLSLNLLSASNCVTIPEKVRIYYEYAALSIIKEQTEDEKSVLEGYQYGLGMKGLYINNTILDALRKIDDPTLSDQEKVWYAKRCFSDLASSHTIYGMVSFSDNRMVKLAEQLDDLENNQPVIDPSRFVKDIYFVVLLDYKERTDTLSMSNSYYQVFYKGKLYKSRTVFFTILDMIRDLDPIWRKENEIFYEGKNEKENEKKELEEIEKIFNQIIGS